MQGDGRTPGVRHVPRAPAHERGAAAPQMWGRTLAGRGARVVATGGMGRMMAEYCPLINEVDPSLTLEGLRLIYQHNKDAFRGKKLADNIGNIEVTEEG